MESKQLKERIKKGIMELPTMDVHTHLFLDHLVASDLWVLINWGLMFRDISGALALPDDFVSNWREIDLPRRMEIVLPHLQLIKNTSSFHMLLMLLRDIYHIDVDEITKENWKKINDALLEYRRHG